MPSFIQIYRTVNCFFFWENLHHWQKFYTAAGSDGMDKSHLCLGHLVSVIYDVILLYFENFVKHQWMPALWRNCEKAFL